MAAVTEAPSYRKVKLPVEETEPVEEITVDSKVGMVARFKPMKAEIEESVRNLLFFFEAGKEVEGPDKPDKVRYKV